VDIDAFYASVEQRENPSLRGKPVVVGALPGHRGVVSACSYEARRYGVHSAMPISEAYRRCPQAVFLPVRMSRYVEVSRNIMKLLSEYSPVFHQISIDEAYLDLTGTEGLYGPPPAVGGKMKDEIKKQEDLTISVGIAANRFLAKLASEACKPDGLLLIEGGKETEFLDTLELKDLWGVGAKTLEHLHEIGINTVPQLRAYSLEMLKPMLGEAAGRYLYSAVRGQDPGIHPAKTKSHSISSERTFETDRKDRESLKRTLLDLCQQVMGRLLDEAKRSRTAGIKVRFQDFTTVNAQKTERHWLGSSEELYRIVMELFDKKWDGHTPIRLLGVGVSGVESGPAPQQQELFPDETDRRKKVEEAVIQLRKKMKGLKLTRASLLKPGDDVF
jgi:DNA polymerase-4